MVSTRDLQHVVAQINVKFDDLFKKIAELEKQIDEQGAKDASKKRSKTS
jgi:hypothetical protein